MSDELERIAQEGTILERQEPKPPHVVGAPEQPAAPSQDEEKIALWAMMPTTVGNLLAMALPEVRAVYTPEACNAWGAAMAAVAEKRGWNISSSSPEVVAVLATLPFIVGTSVVIVARRSKAAPEKPAEQRVDAGADVTAAPAAGAELRSLVN